METLPDGSVIITYQLLMIVGGVAGLVLGLIPFGLGIARKKALLGIIALVVCVLIGIPFSVLGALPAAAIFTYLIVRKKKTDAVEQSPTDGFEPPQNIV